MMSLRSRVARTTRRATSAMQQRTTTDHAAMLTLGYDCAGNCLVDSDGDGTCDQDEVSGMSRRHGVQLRCERNGRRLLRLC